jgi:hypothetical protein
VVIPGIRKSCSFPNAANDSRTLKNNNDFSEPCCKSLVESNSRLLGFASSQSSSLIVYNRRDRALDSLPCKDYWKLRTISS